MSTSCVMSIATRLLLQDGRRLGWAGLRSSKVADALLCSSRSCGAVALRLKGRGGSLLLPLRLLGLVPPDMRRVGIGAFRNDASVDADLARKLGSCEWSLLLAPLSRWAMKMLHSEMTASRSCGKRNDLGSFSLPG
eukprot:2539758-Prymnesium_polylepis.1